MEENKISTIDDYIKSCDESIQPKLNELRQLILDIAPELKEKISWGMPTFYMKKNIIHFAAHKNHVGLYPGPDAIVVFSDRLAQYQTSKGAIKIPNDKEFDKALIKDIILYNIQNIA